MGKIMVNGENYSGSEITANPTMSGGETVLNGIEIDGTKYAVGGGAGGGVNYSTTEQDTGLKWVDGKSIYQKTFLFNNLTTGENVLELGNSSDFDVVIDYEFTCIRNNDRYVNIGFTNVWGEATISLFNFRNVDNKLKVSVTSGYYAASDFYITIRYTKPTV